MNVVILMGRLTAAPELKQTPQGTTVTQFTVAVDRRYSGNGEKHTDFITCVAWRHNAEFICKYFGKGNRIALEGEIQTRSWTSQSGEKRYTTEVMVQHAEFAESKRNSNAEGHSQAAGTFEEIPEDDLPF